MNRNTWILSICVALILGAVSVSLLADAGEQEKARVYIAEGYQAGSVMLEPGYYEVIHKHAAEEQGNEACTFFYRLGRSSQSRSKGSDPAAKLRCVPATGSRTADFRMVSRLQPDGTRQIRSIQFAGSEQVHAFEPGS